MPKYMVLEKTYLKHSAFTVATLAQVGEVIDYDGVPGVTLAALDQEAAAAKAAAIAVKHRSRIVANIERVRTRQLRASLADRFARVLAKAEAALPKTETATAQ